VATLEAWQINSLLKVRLALRSRPKASLRFLMQRQHVNAI
jgi:hypothetical protein